MEVVCTCEVETTLMDIISYKKLATCFSIRGLKLDWYLDNITQF
jgi:hypothetical protein